jgi:hypothetical protein
VLIAKDIPPVQSTNGYLITCVLVSPWLPANELAPNGVVSNIPALAVGGSFQLFLMLDLL